MDISESQLTSYFLESSIKRLRDDFDRLRRKGKLIHHALIESASKDRENLLLKNMERIKALPERWTACAEQDGLRSLRATYAPSDLIEEFSKLEHQGNLLLKSIDTASLRLQFGTLKHPPWGWRASWVIFVHVLSWHNIPGTLLSAERLSCINLYQWIPLDHVLSVRDGMQQPIEDEDYSLIPDPADWYSMIDDFAGASMSALDIIANYIVQGVPRNTGNLPIAGLIDVPSFDWPTFDAERLIVQWRRKVCRFNPRQEQLFRLVKQIVDGYGGWVSRSKLCHIDSGVWKGYAADPSTIRSALSRVRKVFRNANMNRLAKSIRTRISDGEMGVYLDMDRFAQVYESK